jgi:hypothetical protein
MACSRQCVGSVTRLVPGRGRLVLGGVQERQQVRRPGVAGALAQEFGRPLGMTGEIGEARLLGLELEPVRTAGLDARDPRTGRQYQIKARAWGVDVRRKSQHDRFTGGHIRGRDDFDPHYRLAPDLLLRLSETVQADVTGSPSPFTPHERKRVSA